MSTPTSGPSVLSVRVPLNRNQTSLSGTPIAAGSAPSTPGYHTPQVEPGETTALHSSMEPRQYGAVQPDHLSDGEFGLHQ
jgi:hypothetical protein